MDALFEQTLREAASSKHAAIREAIARAQESYTQETSQSTHSLRDACITPFQLCLESKTSKLIPLGIQGLQKILSEERLKCREGEIEHEDDTMPNQILRAVAVTPSLGEEHQVDVMKLLLMVACSNSSHVSPQTVINIAKFCQSVYAQSKPEVHKACQVTMLQVMTDVAHSTNQQACINWPFISPRQPNPVSNEAKVTLTQTLTALCQSQVKTAMSCMLDTGDMAGDVTPDRLCGDVVAVLGFLCNKVSETHKAGSRTQNQTQLTFELEAILAMLTNMDPCLRGSSAFQNVLWKELCPTLIAILGIPKDQKTIVSSHSSASSNHHPDHHHHLATGQHGQEHGRGSGSVVSVPVTFRSARHVIYCIAGELIRLVGCVASMRPVIGSLLHRMLLFPPPSQRGEALKVLKEILSTPGRILDLAGPAIEGAEITSLSSKDHKSDLDLIKLLMDGITEASGCPEVCMSSVGCVGALLASLEEIGRGKGMSVWQGEELLRRAKEEEEENKRAGENDSDPGAPCLTPQNIRSQSIQDGQSEQHPTDDATDAPNKGEDQSETVMANGEREGLECEEEVKTEEELQEVDPMTPKGGYRDGEEDANGGNVGDGREKDEEKVGTDDADPVAIAAAAFADEEEDEEEEMEEENGDGEDGKEKQGNEERIRHDDDDNGDDDVNGSEIIQNRSNEQKDGSDENIYLEEEAAQKSDVVEEDGTGAESGEPLNDGRDDRDAFKNSPERHPQEKSGEDEARKPAPGSPSAAAEQAAILNARLEREAAGDFANALMSVLPSLLGMEDVMDVDRTVQMFASKYVTGYTLRKSDPDSGHSKLNLTPVINADGIYVATYSSLLLNLKLVRSHHYDNPASLPLTQKQFIDSVHYSGVLVYLSATWLGELYRLIITRNLLGEGGYQPAAEHCNRALVSILTDLDGLGSQELGGQMLHDAPTYSQGIKTLHVSNTNPEGAAGLVFARQMLTTFWRRILSILALPLSTRGQGGSQGGGLAFLLGSEPGSRDQSARDRDAICLSLNGLRKAAELSCTLGLQTRCAAVFSQLSEASCVSDHPTDSAASQEPLSRIAALRGKLGKGHGMRLHAAHVLSMDVLLSMGLEMGSHSPDCWSHVFRCCAFVSQLEHTQFSSTSSQPSVTPLPKVKESTRLNDPADDGGDLDLLPPYLSAAPPPPEDEASGVSSIDVQEIIRREREEVGIEVGSAKGGLLSVAKAAKVVCGLSAGVDRLFDEAASILNLQALLGFLRELRGASQAQLYRTTSHRHHPSSRGGPHSPPGGPPLADHSLVAPTSPSKSLPTGGRAETSLLLFRLGDVILKCVRHRSRPLLHRMRAWSVVAPHLVEAACHRDRHVSKRAVDIIHDVLMEVMMSSQELPHFSFHEALLKPFESLLRLELCDNDVQDQVVSSICELVEGSFSNIKSGWRPLFGALRAVRMQPRQHRDANDSPDRAEHPLAPVCNVFEAFLNTDNVTVFANAAIDCILCLLKFVRGGSNPVSDPNSDVEDDAHPESSSSPRQRPPMTYGVFDLCFPALNYLHRCHKILTSIYQMPSCPTFRGSQSIKLGSRECFPQGEMSPQRSFPLPTTPTSPQRGGGGGLSSLGVDDELFEPMGVESVDEPTGIMRVWFLLIEGLTGAVALCPRRYQPPTLELLFELLRSINIDPGPMFGVYAVTELLLPMMHSWVRRNRHVHSTWDATTANFKQACGLATDLVVGHLTQGENGGGEEEGGVGVGMSTSTPGEEKDDPPPRGLCLMLKQMLDILVECIGQSNEAVARLGCSCIRHLLLSAGPHFSHDMWTVACNGMQRAVATSLRCIRQLMSCFHPGSDDFMGDVCPVKVAARRDVTDMEYLRLQQLAQQVLLLDTQRRAVVDLTSRDEPRSFIFIIYPPDTDLTTNIDQIRSRVSFRGIVLGLLAHQLLIQTLGTILLHGAEVQVSEEFSAISTTSLPSQLSQQHPTTDDAPKQPPFDSSLPGLLSYLSPKNLSLLLECFVQSYQIACEFNCRPGLKFLLQKVAKFEVAANLYWQGAMSFTFYLHTLLELCHHTPREKMEASHIKDIIRALCRHEGNPRQNPEFAEGSPNMTEAVHASPRGRGGGRKRSKTRESIQSQTSCDSVNSVDSLHLKCELIFHPSSPEDLDWLIKRLHGICNDVCATFIQMHVDPKHGKGDAPLASDMALFFLVAPSSPEKPQKRLFTFELEDDPLSDGDCEEDEDEEGEGGSHPGHSRQRSSSLPKAKGFKFASHWTPNVKLGSEVSGEVKEQEVNVIEQPRMSSKEKLKSQGSEGEEDQLYTVATKKAIRSLMQEYKKRKQHHSRSIFVKKPTFKEQKYTRKSGEASPLTAAERQRRKQIQDEQQSSIVQDGEAQMGTWANMLGTMLRLIQLLPQDQFTAFLPAIFPCINQLVCHVADDHVRTGVMEFMDRVAHIHGIV